MSEAAEAMDTTDGQDVDSLISEWEAEEGQAEAEANRLSPEEERKVREMAEKLNGGFLFLVKKTQCPHVDLDAVIDREKGDQAMMPLAEKFGGEVPDWIRPFIPYFEAGIYMGTTIATAREAERQVLEHLAREQQKQEQGARHGEQSEPE